MLYILVSKYAFNYPNIRFPNLQTNHGWLIVLNINLIEININFYNINDVDVLYYTL